MDTIFNSNIRLYEYSSAANPDINQLPVLTFGSDLYSSGSSRIINLDISKYLKTDYKASSPNLLASFIRINNGDELTTRLTNTTSQLFYVISGSGYTVINNKILTWSKGDVFVVPYLEECNELYHITENEDAILYWVNDSPLLSFLGVKPCIQKFEIAHFQNEILLEKVEEIKHDPETKHRNRCGVLLGIAETEDTTKTITHTMWSLLNLLPANTSQPPHRHNSVALDLCVYAKNGVNGNCNVYTLMGPELEDDGKTIKDPIRVNWSSGGAFITPPGWWHSHHNETDEDAWVLPVQDAGLHTHMRTLDIKFCSR